MENYFKYLGVKFNGKPSDAIRFVALGMAHTFIIIAILLYFIIR